MLRAPTAPIRGQASSQTHAPPPSGLRSSRGLEIFDAAHLQWRDAEDGLQPDELTVFAGETLTFLSGGEIPAPLHRVRSPSSASGRLSMPFFLRARPLALLTPLQREPSCEGAGKLAARVCQDYTIEELYARRPWRSAPTAGTIPDF